MFTSKLKSMYRRSVFCASWLALTAAGSASNAAEFDCLIDPSLQLNIGSPVTGVLEEVLVDRGDRVSKGDVLARISGRVEEVTVELLTARSESDAAIQSAKARKTLAQQAYDRAKSLFDQSITSEQVLEERAATLEIARRSIVEAELDRQLAELERDRALAQLEQRTIRSPIDGWVRDRYMGSGEYLHAEAEILTLVQINPLHVEAFLPESVYSAVELGMTADIRPSHPADMVVTGKVAIIDRVFDASSGSFGMRLFIENPNGTLPAGQRCTLILNLPSN